MLLAMVNDVRVVMVKLADRLHNMRTLEYLEPEQQQRIARETLDIYAPVANRLGMGLIRGELEDLAFRYLEPKRFSNCRRKSPPSRKVFDKFLAEVQDTIRDKMVESGIPAEVQARIKRLYSLHLKIQKQQRMLDQVYDLLAVRVITDTVKNCYAALGVIHQIWRPVPGRFKDYIAMPRPEPLPVAAHHRDSRRAALRSANSHAGNAPHRRARRRGALEIQGRPRDGLLRPTISASSGCAT